MTRFLTQLLLILLAFNTAYSQQDTAHKIRPGHNVSKYPPLYILDGLKISQERFAELKIDECCIRRIRTDEDFSICDSTSKFKGSITIYTKLLIVLNDTLLRNAKDKQELLSKLKQDNVSFLEKVDKEEAIIKYGKDGKCGVLIIKTKE